MRFPFSSRSIVWLALGVATVAACGGGSSESTMSDASAGSGGATSPDGGAGFPGAGGAGAAGGAGGAGGTGGDAGSGGTGVGGMGAVGGSAGSSGTGGAAGMGGAAGSDSGPMVLDNVVVTVVGGAPDGNEVLLLDGSGRTATTNTDGQVSFSNVPVPYGVVAQVFAGTSPQPTVEAQGLTRADPVLNGPGFVNVSNGRVTGQAAPAVADGGTVPAGCTPSVIVGNTAVGQLVAADELGNFTSRGLVWPGSAPLSTRLFGLHVCLDATPPAYLSFGLSDPFVIANGDDLTAGLVFDVDAAVPARDHSIDVDFEDLPDSTEATVELWSVTLARTRLPLSLKIHLAMSEFQE